MKNKNIHNGLEDNNVRDFLAKNLGFGYVGSVKHLESQIQQLQKELEQAKKYEAILTLVNLNGWSEWDVSDQISDYKPGEYFPFLGTEDEYNNVFGLQE